MHTGSASARRAPSPTSAAKDGRACASQPMLRNCRRMRAMAGWLMEGMASTTRLIRFSATSFGMLDAAWTRSPAITWLWRVGLSSMKATGRMASWCLSAATSCCPVAPAP